VEGTAEARLLDASRVKAETEAGAFIFSKPFLPNRHQTKTTNNFDVTAR